MNSIDAADEFYPSHGASHVAIACQVGVPAKSNLRGSEVITSNTPKAKGALNRRCFHVYQEKLAIAKISGTPNPHSNPYCGGMNGMRKSAAGRKLSTVIS